MKKFQPAFHLFKADKNWHKQLLILVLTVVSGSKSFGQTTYTWNRTGIADWAVAVNWTPARIAPATNDILVFNNGAVSTPINIPSETIGQLSISNTSTVNLQSGSAGNQLIIAGITTGDDLQLAMGSSLNINGSNALKLFVATGATAVIEGTMVFSTAPHRIDAAGAGAIVFNSPASFIQDAGCTGNVFTAAGTANTIVFNPGSSFIQKSGANPFGLVQPASKVIFNIGSLFKVQQVLFLSFSGRTYADLEIDFPGFNQSVTGVNPLTIYDITITSGTLSLNLTGGINIKGAIAVAAGQSLSFNPAAAGTLLFNGSILQTVSNTGTLNFNNNEAIIFNNGAGIQFNSNIGFNNAVNFVAGIIRIPNPYIFTLGAAAIVTGVSNNSFVDGLVAKIGNTAFVFPIGKDDGLFTGYVPLAISAPATASAAFTAEYKRQSAVALSNNYAAGLDHVSGVDYWTLNSNSGAGPVDVTLYWTNQSSANGGALYINNLSKLVIAHFNGSNQWDNYGGSFNTGSGFAAGSITWAGVHNFNVPFSLGSTDTSNPLPFKLNYFTGVKQGNANHLQWKIECINILSLKMLVERSVAGRKFDTLTTVTTDALHCLQPFDFTDNNPLPGINYYRLKMTDANGKTTYSTTIALLNKASGFDSINLYPNPVRSNAILNVAAAQKAKMDIVITDISGRQVQKINCNLIAGNNQIILNLANLAAGSYQLIGYTVGGVWKTIRFVKQ